MLSIFTRHFYPSAVFIVPCLEYLAILNRSLKNIFIDESVENIIRFLQAMEVRKPLIFQIEDKYKFDKLDLLKYRRSNFT